MSFRYYLGKVPKKKRDELKAKSVAQLEKYVEDDCVRPYMIAKKVYELGSDFNEKELRKFYLPFFTNKATHKELSTGEEQFIILTKEGFLKLIDMYHEKIAEFCKNQEESVKKLIEGKLDPYESAKLQDSMRFKTIEWTDKKKMDYLPYNLTDKDCLVNSWKYEYAIFELVNIYKKFNFEKDYLILYGY